MENLETIKINNETFKNYLSNKQIKELYNNLDYNYLFETLLNHINNNNIQLYNIELEYNSLIIRLNNLLINNAEKLNSLETLINELNNNYAINYYTYNNYLFIIEIELNYY